jgi:CubicO group peptidase (beta-lactamase class C family)
MPNMQPTFRRTTAVLAILVALCCQLPARAQLASTTSLPRGDAKAAGVDPDKLRAIDALLSRAVDERQIAGAVALVARRGKIVHLASAGMQDAEAGLPIREDTIYRIASMTKPITSVAAMMLVEEDKLRLEDPVSKFIPEFAKVRVLRHAAPATEPLATATTVLESPITIRHLLTHTSGITYGFWDRPILGKLYREVGVSDGLIETPGTMGDNVKKLAGVPLLFQPGSSWEYGLNTDVLGRVVEVASGQTLSEFVQGRIFRPLNMLDSHFVLPSEKRSRLAALYTPGEAKKIRRVAEGPQINTSAIGTVQYSATYPLAETSQYQSGGAGLVSTIGDYTRFLQMLLNGGQLDGQRLLRPETIAQMTQNQIGDFTPSIATHGDKFGYGFGVVTTASKDEVAGVGSYSWGGIFHTYFLADPQKELILVFMTQIFPFDHLTLHGDFKRLVYASLLP